MTPVVLIHGGGFDARCWDLVVPRLAAPAIAVDLPGRGRRPVDLRSVDINSCAAAIVADIDDAGFDQVVLAGHSMAGCSIPAAVGLLGDRVRHVMFIACTVPAHGSSILDTLDPEIQDMVRSADGDAEPAPMSPEIAKIVLGDDLSGEQLAWCMERTVPEASGLIHEPVNLSPMDGRPCTWLRTLNDLIVPAEKQLRFADNLHHCEVIDIDSGHMCMVSRPDETAAVISQVSSTAG